MRYIVAGASAPLTPAQPRRTIAAADSEVAPSHEAPLVVSFPGAGRLLVSLASATNVMETRAALCETATGGGAEHYLYLP